MIRIGVIGYGYWGPNLVRNFAEMRRSPTVAAVADLDPTKLDERATRAYPAVQDHHRLPASCSRDPDDRRDRDRDAGQHALRARHGGAARPASTCWLEKPMTETSLQARKLVDEAERRQLVLIVDHTFVYTGAVRKMGELIKSRRARARSTTTTRSA